MKALTFLSPLLFLVACGGSSVGGGTGPEAPPKDGVQDDGTKSAFVPPCATADACPPFKLVESSFLPFRVQATDRGFAYLSRNGVEEWTYAAAKGQTIWTSPDGSLPRAFAVGKTSILVGLEDGTFWRFRRDGSDARTVVTDNRGVMRIVAVGEDFYWVSFNNEKLFKLGPDDTLQVVSDRTCGALGLEVANDEAYVLSDTCRGIFSIPLGGGEKKTVWQDFAGGKPAYGATDGTALAWINLMSKDAGVNLTDFATGETRLLAPFRDMPAPDPEGNTLGVAVALDANHVYFASETAFAGRDSDGRVYAIDRHDGTRVELSDSATNVKDVAVDDRLVVWIHWSSTSWGLMARMK